MPRPLGWVNACSVPSHLSRLSARTSHSRSMVPTHSVATERRRSQRIPLSVPLIVRSVGYPSTDYGELPTVEVSGHGCLLHSLHAFDPGNRLRIVMPVSNRMTTAHVVHSDPTGRGTRMTTWTVALELEKPGNFWGVPQPPPDWPKTSEAFGSFSDVS